jgi:16S rRNA (guanine966-N2)-methyltransferase
MRGKREQDQRVSPGRRRDTPSALAGRASVSKQARSTAARFVAAPSRVRIIGGRWKRTPLPVADLPELRPSPDRVRETLFNWIAHLVPDLSALRGLDLFAGTGALGFELASRGAAHVTLVECHRELVNALEATRAKLGADGVRIVAGDALAVARGWPDRSFDVVFLDPPFDGNLLTPALEEGARLVADHGLVYVESGAPLPDTAPRTLTPIRSGRAGQVHFHLLQRA